MTDNIPTYKLVDKEETTTKEGVVGLVMLVVLLIVAYNIGAWLGHSGAQKECMQRAHKEQIKFEHAMVICKGKDQ